jgi:hypothetical protein
MNIFMIYYKTRVTHQLYTDYYFWHTFRKLGMERNQEYRDGARLGYEEFGDLKAIKFLCKIYVFNIRFYVNSL